MTQPTPHAASTIRQTLRRLAEKTPERPRTFTAHIALQRQLQVELLDNPLPDFRQSVEQIFGMDFVVDLSIPPNKFYFKDRDGRILAEGEWS